jgi:SRSO17 transposase
VKARELSALDASLERFLAELLAPMGRSERRHWAKMYVTGLLLDGERKSIEPMAARLKGADVQALRQFVGQSPWDVQSVQRALAHWVMGSLSEPEVWMIDETTFPKAGEHSVGVARQYCGALGKLANCQMAVSLHWSSAQMSCPISWRLYLPKAWIDDSKRCAQARVPEGTTYRSKRQLALELLDQALEWQLPRLPVVADADYGNDFEFRQALRQRGFAYVVAALKNTKVWLSQPRRAPMPPAHKGSGRVRRYAPWKTEMPAAMDLLTVAQQLAPKAWKQVTWRQGSKGPMRSRFACLQVWASHGWQTLAPLPRPAEWLLIEWPKDAETPTDYWLAELGPEQPELRRVVQLARARWRVELDYRELKDELGLDHYEGRHWLGWHHHVTLVSLAFAFLRSQQLHSKKNFTCELAPDTPKPAGAADSFDRPMPVVPSLLH